METPDTILKNMFCSYPELESLSGDIRSAYRMLVNCYDLGGIVLCCGNGGSAADADHIVGELMKGFMLKRPLSNSIARRFLAHREADTWRHPAGTLPAISLTGRQR